MIKYRLVCKQILEEGLNYDDATIAMQILKDQGKDVQIEEYTIPKLGLGRDPAVSYTHLTLPTKA